MAVAAEASRAAVGSAWEVGPQSALGKDHQEMVVAAGASRAGADSAF